MTQCGQILEDSFYQSGLTTELQHATPTQTKNAMNTLANLIAFLSGGMAGEYLNAWPLGNYGRDPQFNYFPPLQVLQRPPLNAQLIVTNTEAMTVYLPVNPSDGARFGLSDPYGRLASVPVTLDGNGRAIDGAATSLQNTNNTNSTYFYRDDLAGWVKVTPLLITDQMPFPGDYDQMFIYMMASELNPVFGHNMSPMQLDWLKQFKQQFTARYVQSAPLQINPELSFTSRQSYQQFQDSWFGGANTQTWDRGGWWGWWGGWGG